MENDFGLAILDENGKIISQRKLNLFDNSMINQGHINYSEGVKPCHTITDEETALFSRWQEYLASGRKK